MNGLINLEAAFTTGGLTLKVDGAIAQEVTRVLISTQKLTPRETPPHQFAKLVRNKEIKFYLPSRLNIHYGRFFLMFINIISD